MRNNYRGEMGFGMITEDELRKKIEKEEEGNFIEISRWKTGKDFTGSESIIVNLDNLNVSRYSEGCSFLENKRDIKISFKKDKKITKKIKEELVKYLEEEKIFTFNVLQKKRNISGTNLTIIYNNINCNLINGDKNSTNNRIDYFDKILEILKLEI